MKKVILFFSAVGLCALLTFGIILGEKESPQHEQVLRGIQNIQSDDGHIVYSGTVVPPVNLGNIGDFYLHAPNSNLYGPKTADGWGKPVSLSHAARTPEAGQVQILTGAEKAVTNMTAMDDYYLFTTR